MTAPATTATVQWEPARRRFRVIVRQPIPGGRPAQLHSAFVRTETDVVATLRAWRVAADNAEVLAAA